jgi:excisionase family DNA binding protein
MHESESQTPLLTVGQVSRRLRVSPQSVYRLVRSGEIPALRLGHGRNASLRFDPDEIEAWLYAAAPQERTH